MLVLFSDVPSLHTYDGPGFDLTSPGMPDSICHLSEKHD